MSPSGMKPSSLVKGTAWPAYEIVIPITRGKFINSPNEKKGKGKGRTRGKN